MRNNKKIGPGSLSLLFCIIGILFAVSFKNYGCLGDYILKHLGLNPWSHGNFGAKTGKIVSVIMLIFILFLCLFSPKITSG